jgi:hypothetical protein
MTAMDTARKIARDTSCAQGEFHERVKAIYRYVPSIWFSWGLGVAFGATATFAVMWWWLGPPR